MKNLKILNVSKNNFGSSSEKTSINPEKKKQSVVYNGISIFLEIFQSDAH